MISAAASLAPGDPLLSRPVVGAVYIRRLAILLTGAAFLFGQLGCSSAMNQMPGAKPSPVALSPTTQIAVQHNVMRFSDLFRERITNSLTVAQFTDPDPEVRLVAQTFKVNEVTAAVQIASGPSAVINAIDMVVLVTLSRILMEDEWVPKYGERARPVLRAFQLLEPDAWDLVKGVITPQQETELRMLLAGWRAKNPGVKSVAFVRIADVVDVQSVAEAEKKSILSPGGLFGLVGLDPLAGIDPAVREVEQTRLVAERAIYYFQRLPALMDLEVGLVTAQLLNQPETREMLASTTRLSTAAQSMAGTAAQMPDLITRERAAAIDQIMSALQGQEARTRELLTAAKQTLESGTATADSTNNAIRSLNALITEINKPTPGPPSRPFDINEYANAAAQFAQTAKDLEQLLATLDQRTPQVATALGQATDRGRELVDYAFRRALLLVGILLAGILLIAVVSRWIGAQFSRGAK